MLHFSFLWKEKLRFGSVKLSPATVHRTSAFRSSNLPVPTKKETHRLVCFSFVISVHYRYSSSEQVPARFVTCFLSFGKKTLRFGSVKPSPATVHRTVASNSSNLPVLDFSKQKNDLFQQVVFYLEVPARFELANNGFADRGLTTWLRYHMK